MKPLDEKKLIILLQKLLEVDSLEAIKDLSKENCPKWDSLVQMSLVSILENEFSVTIEITDFEKLISYKSIKMMLEGKGI